jgi:hypothetical protein
VVLPEAAAIGATGPSRPLYPLLLVTFWVLPIAILAARMRKNRRLHAKTKP